MKKIKVTIDEVFGDDMNTPFWQSILANPAYPKAVSDIDYIIQQSQKHGRPFNEIDPELLDPYTWKLK